MQQSLLTHAVVHDAGNLIGLAISPIILAMYGWRALFMIFGILGGPLLAFWLLVVPDQRSKGAAVCRTSNT